MCDHVTWSTQYCGFFPSNLDICDHLLSYAILPPLTNLFVSFVRVIEGSGVGSAWSVVHVDVQGEWVMLWGAAMYNLVATLSVGDMVCLACMLELWSA